LHTAATTGNAPINWAMKEMIIAISPFSPFDDHFVLGDIVFQPHSYTSRVSASSLSQIDVQITKVATTVEFYHARP
jgi:hypothetical protein